MYSRVQPMLRVQQKSTLMNLLRTIDAVAGIALKITETQNVY